MTRSRTVASGLVVVIALGAAGEAVAQGSSPAAMVRADSGRPRFTAADVRFVQGMIGHHAQAVVMAQWAPTHGANAAVRRLCERIDVGQRDEIVAMQRWLRDRKLDVPDPSHAMMSHSTGHSMAGMTMGDTLMPGMLTPEQMQQLDAARGADFDRLFLTFMIQHHEGAISMVRQLFGSTGAAQDTWIFRFASDVETDQITEIDRMRAMLGSSSG